MLLTFVISKQFRHTCVKQISYRSPQEKGKHQHRINFQLVLCRYVKAVVNKLEDGLAIVRKARHLLSKFI